MRQRFNDLLYLLGSCLIDYAGVVQALKIWRTKSADDFTLWYPTWLLVGVLLLMPLTFSSDKWAWKVGQVLQLFILGALWVLVWLYR